MTVEHFTYLSISQLIDMYEAEQEAQGRRRNYRVLLNDPWGGINWERTASGHRFWHTLLIETDFVDIIRDLEVTESCPKCGADNSTANIINSTLKGVKIHEGCCHFNKGGVLMDL